MKMLLQPSRLHTVHYVILCTQMQTLKHTRPHPEANAAIKWLTVFTRVIKPTITAEKITTDDLKNRRSHNNNLHKYFMCV